jgi:hypothetical protein
MARAYGEGGSGQGKREQRRGYAGRGCRWPMGALETLCASSVRVAVCYRGQSKAQVGDIMVVLVKEKQKDNKQRE